MKNILTFAILLIFAQNSLSQKRPNSVVWGEKIKKSNELGAFKYKNDKLYTINYKLKSIQSFSPDKLTLLETLNLEGVKGSFDGQSFDLFEGISSLIEYKSGVALYVEYLSKEKKMKYYGIFELADDLSKVSTNGKILFEMNLGKKEEFQVSTLQKANENYQAIFSYNTPARPSKIAAQLDVVSSKGEVNTIEFSKEDFDNKEKGRHFTFSKDAYLINRWDDNSSEITLYDGISGSEISTLDLKEFLEGDGRVLSMKRMPNGEFILAGFYGNITSKKNEMVGLFKIVLNKAGQIKQQNSGMFKISEIKSTQESSSVQDILITDAGDLYFVMTSTDGEKATMNGIGMTAYEQLMVVGIHGDEIWSKSIPFRQGYGSLNWPDHLGPHINEINGNLILSYNDNRKNGKKFDYNEFVYSSKNRPEKYICALPEAIAIVDIDNTGNVKPYFIDVYDVFTNLTETVTLNDGSLFIAGNMVTVAGAGKSLFAKVKL